jgi:REP element-mobilizing transposase RayT
MNVCSLARNYGKLRILPLAPKERPEFAKAGMMANTYSQIYIQVVFAVSERQCLITNNFKEELYKYIAGVVRNENQKLIAINGIADHIHILMGLKPDVTLSTLVGKSKHRPQTL